MSGIFEQDFIMQQIEHLVRVLQRIIIKKKQGLQQEAQIIIDQTLYMFLEDDSKDFQSLSLSETLEALKTDSQFNAELAYVVGDILYEKAELESTVSRASKIYKQALLLFYKAQQYPGVAFPVTTAEKISRIEEKLEPSSLADLKILADEQISGKL